MIKEMINVEAAFRLIKSNKLIHSCSLFLHQGFKFKKFELGEVLIKHDHFQWFSELLKFIPDGMVKLMDDRGIVVGQKILKSTISKLDRGDQTRFSYTLGFTPRLLEFETLPKGITVNGSHINY